MSKKQKQTKHAKSLIQKLECISPIIKRLSVVTVFPGLPTKAI